MFRIGRDGTHRLKINTIQKFELNSGFEPQTLNSKSSGLSTKPFLVVVHNITLYDLKIIK